MMGSPSSEPMHENDEAPHEVSIVIVNLDIYKGTYSSSSRNYYMGKYEVTQAQWQAIMGNNPSFRTDSPSCPVENVSWSDIQAFIQRVKDKTGKTYRLPTEAEWEYACRAGSAMSFSTGSCLDGSQANYDASKPYKNCTKGASEGQTIAVGSFSPNDFGLHDMHGNVSEWCADWYGAYGKNSEANPKGANSGKYRVIRGGSATDEAAKCRSAARSNSSPNKRYNSVGFRLVLEQ